MKKKNPVNPRDLTYETILSKGLGKLTRKASNMLVILVENAINKKEYDYDDKHDCMQTSYFNILSNWQKFNPDKTNNAFAYFTEIHKRATTEYINFFYMKKGLKKEEQNSIRTISINSTNNGQGLYNI